MSNQRKPRVGIYGYSPTDTRIARIKKARKQRIVWVAPFNQPETAMRKIMDNPPDILVINPRHSSRLVGLDQPLGIIVVKKAQPFGEQEIDVTPV